MCLDSEKKYLNSAFSNTNKKNENENDETKWDES